MNRSTRIRNTAASIQYVPGANVLVSYDTPVAAYVWAHPPTFLRTKQYYSVTTTRHINEFLATHSKVLRFHPDMVELVDQSTLDTLLQSGAYVLPTWNESEAKGDEDHATPS